VWGEFFLYSCQQTLYFLGPKDWHFNALHYYSVGEEGARRTSNHHCSQRWLGLSARTLWVLPTNITPSNFKPSCSSLRSQLTELNYKHLWTNQIRRWYCSSVLLTVRTHSTRTGTVLHGRVPSKNGSLGKPKNESQHLWRKAAFKPNENSFGAIFHGEEFKTKSWMWTEVEGNSVKQRYIF